MSSGCAGIDDPNSGTETDGRGVVSSGLPSRTHQS